MTEDKRQALNDILESGSVATKREVSSELEKILYEPLELLDHGFVRVIDYMGTDAAITQAARVSYGKGTKTPQSDTTLINYLMRHSHTSPFEMCEIKLHIKAPIFVLRQWLRHRTANVNEYSGRYSIMEDSYYVPENEYLRHQCKHNKQGRGATMSEELTAEAATLIKSTSDQAFTNYHKMLSLGGSDEDKERGLSREIARMVLPLNTYSELYWKIDLHNLLHFVSLRATSHAQYEIRVYAEKILDIVKSWVPKVYDAFMRYKHNSVPLSAEAHRVIQDLLAHKEVKKADYKLTKREWTELAASFDLAKVKD